MGMAVQRRVRVDGARRGYERNEAVLDAVEVAVAEEEASAGEIQGSDEGDGMIGIAVTAHPRARRMVTDAVGRGGEVVQAVAEERESADAALPRPAEHGSQDGYGAVGIADYQELVGPLRHRDRPLRTDRQQGRVHRGRAVP